MEDLGDDVEAALAQMTKTVDELPGAFRAEFCLAYWAGVVPPAEAWACTAEGDILGDDGPSFTVLGRTAADALNQPSDEVRRRIPGDSSA